MTSLPFPVKLFELDGSLQPATELPCIVCGIGDRWKFAIPPRPVAMTGSLPPRRFKAMTMIGPISALWPSDGNYPATAPFADTSINGIAFTGRRSPTRDGCLTHNRHSLPDGTRLDTCTRVAHITPYRALTALHIRTDSSTRSTYSTAPTPSATLLRSLPEFVSAFTWDRLLPAYEDVLVRALHDR